MRGVALVDTVTTDHDVKFSFYFYIGVHSPIHLQ